MTRSDGFSLVEVLIALALVVVVLSAAFGLLSTQVTLASAWPESVDLQQRARVALDAIVRDLQLAGAGVDAGPMTGPLIGIMPAVLPRRIGREGADPPATARPDMLTVIYVPVSAHQTWLDADLASPASTFAVRPSASCPRWTPLCGITAGMTLLAFDRLGNFDLFDVTAASGEIGQLSSRRTLSANHPYVTGDVLTEAVSRTYYLDRTARQLRRYDGDSTDFPVVDHVVDLAFEYWGDPEPPVHPRPPDGVGNCLYDAGGTRLPADWLPSEGGTLAALPLAVFRDGPWCGNGEHQFDADLLRIRRIRVMLRLHAPNDMQRGQGADYAVAGRGTNALRLVPDLSVAIDVAPRNLNLGR